MKTRSEYFFYLLLACFVLYIANGFYFTHKEFNNRRNNATNYDDVINGVHRQITSEFHNNQDGKRSIAEL